MVLKKALILAVLLLMAGTVPAAEEPRIYVIKKGDTLWGISERFIKDPFYWPSLWATNPDIRNPHFIYPGQKLRIFPDRIEIVTAEGDIEQILEQAQSSPEVRTAVSGPDQAMTIKALGGYLGFIDKYATSNIGTLVDATDNRIMMGEGDKVFVELTDPARVTPGDSFTVFALREEVYHPRTGEALGFFVKEQGRLQITQMHDAVATAVITDADSEIERGAYLRPPRPAIQEIELREAPAQLTGEIIGNRQENIALGQNMVAYIDLGAEDGLLPGNLLIISRPRQASEIAESSRKPWTEPLELPETVLGAAVVIETQPRTASILVLKSVESIYRGDRVHTETR